MFEFLMPFGKTELSLIREAIAVSHTSTLYEIAGIMQSNAQSSIASCIQMHLFACLLAFDLGPPYRSDLDACFCRPTTRNFTEAKTINRTQGSRCSGKNTSLSGNE